MHIRLRKVFLLAGFLALFALPAAAATGAGEHCAHDDAHAAHHEAAVIEEVPAGSAESQASCPQNPTHACKATMTMKCNMKAGCCIKADGPHSSGLSDRPATDNNLVLNDQPARITVSRMAKVSYCRWFIPQDRQEPIPRPPSA